MKLHRILSTLSDDVRPSIHRYVLCQYGSDTLEGRTWSYLYSVGSCANELTMSELRSAIGHSGSMSSYRNAVSRLCSAIEDGIVIYEMQHDPIGQDRRRQILSSYYKRRGSLPLYRDQLSKRRVAGEGLDAYDPMGSLYQVEYHYDRIYSELPYKEKQESYESLREAVTSLTSDMEQLLSIESSNANSPYEMREHAVSSDGSERRLTVLLDEMKRVVEYGSSQDYETLWAELLMHHHDMPAHLVQMGLIYLNNYSYHQIREGDERYYERLIDVLDFGLEHSYLLSQGLLSERRFINLVELKSYFSSDEEVERAISEWISHLNTDDPAPLHSMAVAFQHFGKGRYDECVAALHEVSISRSRYWLQLIRRWLLLCALSTYRDHRHYMAELAAAEKYFERSRAKIGERYYRGSTNLITILRMMHRDIDPDHIQKEVSRMDHMVMRYWIDQEIRKGHAIH